MKFIDISLLWLLSLSLIACSFSASTNPSMRRASFLSGIAWAPDSKNLSFSYAPNVGSVGFYLARIKSDGSGLKSVFQNSQSLAVSQWSPGANILLGSGRHLWEIDEKENTKNDVFDQRLVEETEAFDACYLGGTEFVLSYHLTKGFRRQILLHDKKQRKSEAVATRSIDFSDFNDSWQLIGCSEIKPLVIFKKSRNDVARNTSRVEFWVLKIDSQSHAVIQEKKIRAGEYTLESQSRVILEPFWSLDKSFDLIYVFQEPEDSSTKKEIYAYEFSKNVSETYVPKIISSDLFLRLNRKKLSPDLKKIAHISLDEEGSQQISILDLKTFQSKVILNVGSLELEE